MFTYALIFTVCAVGLWRRRRWGRSLALIAALANAGLGALSLLAVILSRDPSFLAPAAFFVVNVALAYALTRPVFGLPGDA